MIGVAGAGAVGPAAADSTTVAGDYRIAFAGIPLASAAIKLTIDDASYDGSIFMQPSGVGNIVTAIRTQVAADGRIRRGQLDPRNYFVEASDRSKGIRVNMSMSGGSVRSLDAQPPLKPHPDRVAVKAGDKRGIVDPLSSGLMPYPANAALGAKACERTLKIFDGWTRYDVRLHFRRMETVTVGDYAGPAAVCGARWVPISGHRNGRKEVEYLKANKGLEAWLMPVPGQDFLMPLKVAIQTRNGVITVEARDLKISASGGTSARG
jgi:hypothetical protein